VGVCVFWEKKKTEKREGGREGERERWSEGERERKREMEVGGCDGR